MSIDKITGLLTYEGFFDEADKELDFSTEKYAIVSTDFSNFKSINLKFGAEEADAMLKEFADYMCRKSEDCVVAGRTYSDHIVGIFKTGDSRHRDFADKVMERNNIFAGKIREKYSMPLFRINTGIYFIEKGKRLSEAMDNANVARRLMKNSYDSEVVIYSDELVRYKNFEADLIAAYKRSLEREDIMVLLQPKVDIEKQTVVGAEALSRMIDDEGCIIMPDMFIPVLEKTGDIIEYDNYIARRVYAIIRQMTEKGFEPVPVSINLSKKHFYEDEYIDNIISDFEKSGISSKYIEFEITEEIFKHNITGVISRISRLKELGFRVSIDDFGSGYSSLNLIGILPIDIVKLDKGFVRNGFDNERGKGLVKGLITTLNGIDMEIICEGVETKKEEQAVYELGCNEVQGFLHGEPMDVEEFCEKYGKGLRKRE